jgi:elongator complex protein 3
MRSESGVMVIAVFTSPYPKTGEKIAKFSCPYDCHYCPSEPSVCACAYVRCRRCVTVRVDQPRSYLLKEPGVLRANRNNFHCVAQFWDRAISYHMMGLPVDKIELLVLGGTWYGST